MINGLFSTSFSPTLFLFHGVDRHEANLAIGKSNAQLGALDGSDLLMSSLRKVSDNSACSVRMLVNRRAVSEHELSLRTFNLDGAAGKDSFGSGGHCGEHDVVRAGENSATKTPRN